MRTRTRTNAHTQTNAYTRNSNSQTRNLDHFINHGCGRSVDCSFIFFSKFLLWIGNPCSSFFFKGVRGEEYRTWNAWHPSSGRLGMYSCARIINKLKLLGICQLVTDINDQLSDESVRQSVGQKFCR